ncbi:hypothetical protein IKF88_00660 [Candidatus Saccharibacteria bacterium]|nr:hypothetical protein [Candidatus Saccharibacteria bacterium]
MKPNDFILNSDYLTLANVENKTYTVTVPTATIPSSGKYTATYNFNRDNIAQTFTRFYIHHSTWPNQKLWGMGPDGWSVFTHNGNRLEERMYVSTPTDGTIKLRIQVTGNVGATIPTHTITIKAFRFKVPNLF